MANGNLPTGSFGSVAKQAPHWAALVIIVALFLYYLDRHDHSSSIVAEQRIDTCHAVQLRGTVALEQLTLAMTEMAVEDAKMRQELHDLGRLVLAHCQPVEHN